MPPVGPYATFGECVGAQKKKGNDDLSSRKICGEMEKQQVKRRGDVLKYQDNQGHLFIKAFLLSGNVNINRWGVTEQSLDQYINTFIGKPLVLTEDHNHPLPPESERIGSSDEYDDDENPNNVVKVDDIVDHWLEYQEPFRVGNIIDIVKKGSTYYSIIEVTDENTKIAFKNNDLPLFVSPAIAQLDPFEDSAMISKWTGIHLAIVSNPAYTIKKALISGQCHDSQDRCLLQLRNASVAENRRLKKLDCGFCRQQALRKYANKVKREVGKLHWARNYDDFLNSSVVTLEPQIKTLTTTENSNNNLVTSSSTVTSTTASSTDGEETPNESVVLTTDSSGAGSGAEQPTASGTNNDKQTETKVITNEVKKLTADTTQCIQIIGQLGVQGPQAEQVCQLIMQSFVDSYNTPNAGKSMNPSSPPPQSGQMGSVSSSVEELNKQISKHVATIEKLQDDLKSYKKNDKTDLQRIAELEDQVKVLQTTLKEKELESYLVAKIADEKVRANKIKRFAELNLTIDDVKELYDEQTAKVEQTPATNTAEVKKTAEVAVVPQGKGKVKLQTASTTDDDDNETNENNSNKIGETNKRILSSFRSTKGVY